jgi:lysophospholipase L1-like esterase
VAIQIYRLQESLPAAAAFTGTPTFPSAGGFTALDFDGVTNRCTIPTAPLAAAQGTFSIDWSPSFTPPAVVDQIIADIASTGFILAFRGDPIYGSDRQSLFVYNDGSIIAQRWTKHTAFDLLRVRVHYGGNPTRPHLEINGWAFKANAAWVAPTIGPTFTFGAASNGSAPCDCRVQSIQVSDVRTVYPFRLAGLGDSISQEQETARVCWERFAGPRVQGRGYVLEAGIGGDQLPFMLARMQEDVIDQDVTDCFLLGGLNDLKANATLAGMQGNATSIINGLSAVGIRVHVGTILPFSSSPAWSAPREAIRIAFNAWILAGLPNVTTAVDTATAMWDPSDHTRLLPAYDIGDGEHPSAEGAAHLADTIMQAVEPVIIMDDGSRVAQGSTDGGSPITLVGGGLVNTACDDDFTGVVIDAAKWATSLVGSGTVQQDDELLLRTGASASSSASLVSVPTFGPVVDIRAAFEIRTDVLRHSPTDVVRFFDFELQLNASNYFRASRLYDPVFGHGFQFTAVVGGVTVDRVVVQNQEVVSGTLRVVRVAGRIIVSINSVVLYDDNPWLAVAPANIVFRAVNESAAVGYDVLTVLDDFSVATVLLVGREPATVVRGDATYCRAISPPAAMPGKVSIAAYTCAGRVVRINDAFEYLPAQQFVVMDASGVTIGILGDGTLRNAGGSGFEVT